MSLNSAASAIAANTFLRSLAGAAFPLFANQMFTGLGVQWAATLLGCVAAVLVPIPIVFYIYGARLRERSAFAPVMQPHAGLHSADDEEEVNKETNGPLPPLARSATVSAPLPSRVTAHRMGLLHAARTWFR